MGKSLIEFQSTKGDVLPAHKVNGSLCFMLSNQSCYTASTKYKVVFFSIVLYGYVPTLVKFYASLHVLYYVWELMWFFFLQFGTHDVVVLKLNKADLGSPALGQGVVYRLKVSD